MHDRNHSRVDRQRTRMRDHIERSPTPEQVADALEEIAEHEVPGTPSISAVRKLLDATGLPVSVGGRTVRKARIQQGDPVHGALRSDDHISHYEVVVPKCCPECEHHLAVYVYNAYHNISGSRSLTCDSCEHVYESDHW